MSRKTVVFVLVSLSLAALSAVIAQSAQYPVNWTELPKPFHTESVNNGPEVIARPKDAELILPDGFVAEEYMSGFIRPRFMLLGPSNEVLLSDSGDRDESSGAVYVLKDSTKTKIIEGLHQPYGLALHEDWLYVACTTSVKRYKYDTQGMKVTSNGEEIIPLHDFGGGHWTRTLLFDRNHEKLYLTVGSASNIDLGEDAMRAAVHRFNPDGSDHETVATGLRNPVGLRWYPGTDDLWAAVQERDGLGDDLVPDYLVKLQTGAFYGWPIAYIGPHPEPRHEDVDQEKIESTLYPDVLLGAHVAVLDILFYTGDQFPEQFRGGMFLAFHGSWNRSRRTGYKIAFIPFEDGKPTSGPEDFLTGWMLDPGKPEVWGRPVGLLQMSDGSLLVSDDGGRKIWRISYVGLSGTGSNNGILRL